MEEEKEEKEEEEERNISWKKCRYVRSDQTAGK